MKRKTITLVVYMLVCISLVSVGFAAWVITGGDKSEATGNITATSVTDKSLTVSAEQWDGGALGTLNAGKINFGSPEGADANTGWLRAESVEDDKLSATFKFTLSSGQALKTVLETATIEFEDTVLDDLQAAGYISHPVITYKVGSAAAATYDLNAAETSAASFLTALTTDANATSVNVEVTITYQWGSDFGGENPYTYYNGKDALDNNLNGLYLKDGVLSDQQNGTLALNKEEANYALTEIFNAVGASQTNDFKLTMTFTDNN